MREDFRNFIQMRGQNGLYRNTQSDMGTAASTRLQKTAMTPGKLKPLFDSSYVSPLKNPSVI
jgi:hypothetical protein